MPIIEISSQVKSLLKEKAEKSRSREMVIGPRTIGGIWLGYDQVGGREPSSCLKSRKLKKKKRNVFTANLPGTFSISFRLGYRAGIMYKIETQVIRQSTRSGEGRQCATKCKN